MRKRTLEIILCRWETLKRLFPWSSFVSDRVFVVWRNAFGNSPFLNRILCINVTWNLTTLIRVCKSMTHRASGLSSLLNHASWKSSSSGTCFDVASSRDTRGSWLIISLRMHLWKAMICIQKLHASALLVSQLEWLLALLYNMWLAMSDISRTLMPDMCFTQVLIANAMHPFEHI